METGIYLLMLLWSEMDLIEHCSWPACDMGSIEPFHMEIAVFFFFFRWCFSVIIFSLEPHSFSSVFSIFRSVLVNDEPNITCTPMDAFHSPALPACRMAKGLLVDTLNSEGLIHSTCLPQPTSHLFLVLCFSPIVPWRDRIYINLKKSRLWQDPNPAYRLSPSGIFSNVLSMVSSHMFFLTHAVWCYPMCSVGLTLDQIFLNRPL